MDVVVANRGEVAVRIIRAARERGFRTHVLHVEAEAESLAVRLADHAVQLPGDGAAAYLDVEAAVQAALTAGRGALVHPGYGFLSESADLASACAASGLTFVGPSPAALRIFGDKVAARAAAEKAGVPVLPATLTANPADIAELLERHPDGVMVKAAAGGGGRGMRMVHEPSEVHPAYERCRAEALSAFGDSAVYAEALISDARHVEVQIVADGTHAVALGDRDCSVQRRHQKLIEIAPAPTLDSALRAQLHRHAVQLAESVGCRGVITVEFLVADDAGWFLEVNPRLQVEHTITEEVTGVDLVGIQFDLALGHDLADLDLGHEPRGYAVQARVNAELVGADGELLPTSGTITQFSAPTGTGVRVDTACHVGMRHGTRFDSLLAKVIARGPTFDTSVRRCSDALAEMMVSGVDTNSAVLRAVLDALEGPVPTSWFGQNIGELLNRATDYASPSADDQQQDSVELGADDWVVRSPMGATVVTMAEPGTVLPARAEVAVLEAMKMQHVVRAERPLRVLRHVVAAGAVVDPHAVLLVATDADHDGATTESAEVDLDAVRADLAEVRLRHATIDDDA
ncbi:ATP-binding protein, partial [Nocardia cyriacigeorgica]